MRRPNLTPPRPVSLEPRAVGTRASGPQLSLPEPPSFRAVRNTSFALGALVFAGFFAGAPYKSADKLGRALQSGDAAQLEEVIDFSALREDLKKQTAEAIGTTAESAGGTLAVAGAALANAMIDTVVRPEMLAELKDAPIDDNTRSRMRFAMKRARVGYDSPLSFSIRVVLADLSDEPIRVTMRRTGLLSWKVKSLTVPKDLSRLQQLKPQAEAPSGPVELQGLVRDN